MISLCTYPNPTSRKKIKPWRSSLSEVSGISTASARTFIHEASTLVLETIEAGIKKHYLVPLTIAQRSRWRRKGIKLHIYNEHTFIAKHLSGWVGQNTIFLYCCLLLYRMIFIPIENSMVFSLSGTNTREYLQV